MIDDLNDIQEGERMIEDEKLLQSGIHTYAPDWKNQEMRPAEGGEWVPVEYHKKEIENLLEQVNDFVDRS